MSGIAASASSASGRSPLGEPRRDVRSSGVSAPTPPRDNWSRPIRTIRCAGSDPDIGYHAQVPVNPVGRNDTEPIAIGRSLVNARGFRIGALVGCILTLWSMQPATAQELEPQRWRHLPIDTNFYVAGFLRTDADIYTDPPSRLDDVTMNLDTWLLGYTRTFELFGKTAQVQLVQPWQTGSWAGTIDGIPAAVDRKGLGDTQVRFAIQLFGAPPLEPEAYATYRAVTKVDTTVGVGLGVQLPTGRYDEDKLINLGANRFAFRPEIGIVHNRGPWSFEASGNISFYTDNNSYFNDSEIETKPLYFAQANVLYRIRPDLWVAAGGGYAAGSANTINGIDNNDPRENILWGAGIGYSFTPWMGVKFQYIRSDVQSEAGMDSNRYLFTVNFAN
jgi:hypothetical protein